MKGEIKRAFTTAELRPVRNFKVDCLTFAHVLVPSHTFNDFKATSPLNGMVRGNH